MSFGTDDECHRILLYDPGRVALGAATRVLIEAGFQCLPTDSPAAAKRVLSYVEPTLLVARLPRTDMPGWALIHHAHAVRSMPVVAIVTRREVEARLRREDPGVVTELLRTGWRQRGFLSLIGRFLSTAEVTSVASVVEVPTSLDLARNQAA